MSKRSRLPQSWLFLFSFLLVCFYGKAIAADLVSFQVSSNVDTEQSNVDFTLGHVFKAGDVAAGTGIAARLSDGTVLNLQVDKKATHADGSLRHAILSARIPTLKAQSSQTVILSNSSDNTSASIPLSALDNSVFDAEVVLQLAQGGRHRASLQTLIAAGQMPDQWLSGSAVTEWQFVSPLRNDAGDAHPHLMARFYVRAYSGMDRIRVSVVIENGWTHVADAQNINYDVSVLIAGETRFSKQNVTHFHHARWRKVFWWGDEPQLDIRHDTAYLIASRAVPNYDQSLVVPDSIIEEVYDKWQTGVAPDSKLKRNELMGPGLVFEYFPATGGRFDIGPFPRWASLYLLSMDPRAKAAMLGTAEQAGSFSIHYRDQPSDRPVTITDYPGISSMTNFNYMAACSNCNSPYSTDGAHQPSLAYLPYLVTGDYFFLEELQFWSAGNMIDSNPGYRDAEKGLVKWRQIRGQAWVLRTLARTAYITPDADEMKGYFTTLVNNNLDWYNDEYTNNASANKLGINVSGYAFAYSDGTGIAPWQDDHFTWAIGQIAELGFDKADSLLRWKSISPISRMTADGYCWLDGAAYSLVIRDTKTSPTFDTFAQVYDKNFTASGACLGVGDMGGYSASPHGYPSTMQTALAVAVDSGLEGGQSAWDQFMLRTIKPDYSVYPNSSILPRTIDGGAGDLDDVGNGVDQAGFSCDNAPAGTIFCDDFESGNLDGRYFEKSSKLSVGDVGRDGSKGIRVSFKKGVPDAGSLKKSFGTTPGGYIGNPALNSDIKYDEIYWRIDLRTQPGWQGGGGDKLSRVTTLANSNRAQGAMGHIWSSGDYLVMDPASGIDVDGNLVSTTYNDFDNLRWLGNKGGNIDLFSTKNSGQWYCIEAHVKLNTPGNEDGLFEFWIDDTLQANTSDLNWHGDWNSNSDNLKLNAVMIENYWNKGSPVDQERYMDNFVISTSRIGCDTGGINIPDTTAPVITLTDEPSVEVTQNTTYNDAGATATATDQNGAPVDITDGIIISSTVNTAKLGNYTVTYTYPGAETVVRNVTVVAAANSAPVLAALTDISVTAGETITLTPSATDADNDSLSLTYSGFMTSASKTTTATDVGEHSVTVTVSDGELNDSQTIKVTILALDVDTNSAPVLATLTDISITAGETVTLTPSATDANNDPLSFTYTGFMTSASKTTTATDVGEHSVTITVSDGELNDSQTIEITILALDVNTSSSSNSSGGGGVLGGWMMMLLLAFLSVSVTMRTSGKIKR